MTSHDDAEKLYSAKINYIRTKTPERVAERLVAACAERGKSSVVVINTGDEERNIALCGAFIRGCDALGEKAAGMFGKLRVTSSVTRSMRPPITTSWSARTGASAMSINIRKWR